jgi:hypothetical protein
MGHLIGLREDVSTVDKRERVNDYNRLVADVRGILTSGQSGTPAPGAKNFE